MSRVTYEFHDVDDGTEVVLTHELPDAQMVGGATEVWAGILDILKAVVADA